MSDIALRSFISQHISDHDYEIVSELPTANKMYETLHDRHQKQGLFAKIKMIRTILDTVSPLHGTPFCQTFDDISRLHSQYIKMGHLTDDQLLSIFILNSLRLHPRMQSSLNDMLANPLTTSADIRNHLEQEDLVIGSGTTPDTALAAAPTKNPRPVCLNCQKPGHWTEFCIASSGQMAGKTIEEVRAAHDAARLTQCGTDRRAGRNNMANTANTNVVQSTVSNAATTDTQTITVNRVTYIWAAPSGTNSALSAISMPAYDEHEYLAILATVEEPKTSIDWSVNSRSTDSCLDDPTIVDCTFPAGRSPIKRIEELLFILDSGTTCHISPEASDFKNLRSTPCHPVKGLCGTAVYAIGMGDIELCIANGHMLKLSPLQGTVARSEQSTKRARDLASKSKTRFLSYLIKIT